MQWNISTYADIGKSKTDARDRCASLPRLAGHALRTLEVPMSSADAERAFSTYNKLICSSRLSLSDESVRVLHSAAWNGDISGRLDLKVMTIKFYAVGKNESVLATFWQW